MGDSVEKTLEGLLPTLLILKENEIFNHKEIRKVIKKRKDFEYRLVGNHRAKDDLLKYIQYETALEVLRIARAHKKGWKKKAILSTSGVNHIMKLFTRAVRMWPEDKKLWNQYIDFCFRAGCTKRVMSLFLEALAHHPRELSYWLLAAERELQLGHTEAPRRLLQLALRQLPETLDLWKQYFRFEVRCLVLKANSLASKTCEPCLGVNHLLVIINGAIRKLRQLDACSFISYVLDYISILLSEKFNPYFVDLEAFDGALTEILKRQSQEEPLMAVFLWKLQMLSCLSANNKNSRMLDNLLSVLDTLNIRCPYTWCAVLLFFYHMFTAIERKPIPSLSEEVSNWTKPQSYFSFNVDEENGQSKEEIKLQSKDTSSSYIHSALISWCQDRETILYRCLALPTERNVASVPCFQPFLEALSVTPPSEAFVCVRLENEIRLFATALRTNYETLVLPKELIMQFFRWFLSKFMLFSISSWGCIMQLVLAGVQMWNILEVDVTLLDKLQLSCQRHFKDSTVPSLERLESCLLRGEIEMIKDRNKTTSLCMLTTGLLDLLRSCSNVPQQILIRIVSLVRLWIQNRYTIITSKESHGEQHTIDGLYMEVYEQVEEWIDCIYRCCSLDHIFFIVKHLLKQLFTSALPMHVSVVLLESEWKRAIVDGGYNTMIPPIHREVIKRTVGVAFIGRSLEQFITQLNQDETKGADKSARGNLRLIMDSFDRLISSALEFDKNTHAYPSITKSLLHEIPLALTFRHLILRYVSLLLAFDKLNDLNLYLIEKPGCIKEPQEPLSEQVMVKFSTLIKCHMNLSTELGALVTTHRNTAYTRERIVNLISKESSILLDGVN